MVRAAVPNDLSAAVVAIETELGTDPAGTLTNVKTYLQTEHNTDGTHKVSLVAMLAGTQTIAGTKTFSAANVHTGAETHSGIETHSGAETHSGREVFETYTNGSIIIKKSSVASPNASNCYLLIGSAESGAGAFYSIGFGYNSGATNAPGFIGLTTTDNGGNTKGKISFHTRNVTTDTAPTENAYVSEVGAIYAAGGFKQPGTNAETLKILRGSVNSIGTTTAGAGFTSAKTATGRYTITFDTNFSTAPSPSVISNGTVVTIIIVDATSVTTSSFGIRCFNSAFSLTDSAFEFVVAGPA